MLKIQVQNPYMDETYEVNTTLAEWECFLENKRKGNEEFFIYRTNSGQIATINPSNYARVIVTEVVE